MHSTLQNPDANGMPGVTAAGTVTCPDGSVVTYDYVDTGGPEKRLLPTQITQHLDESTNTWTNYDIPPGFMPPRRRRRPG